MTAPMIGNYGIAEEDVESARLQLAGFDIRELSRITSNYRAKTDLSSWLATAGVLALRPSTPGRWYGTSARRGRCAA